jgi:hypothetical protein
MRSNNHDFSYFEIIKLDRSKTKIISNGKSYISLLCEIGGLYNTIFFVGFMLTFHYSKSAQLLKLISQLYYIEDSSLKTFNEKYKHKENQN